MDGKCLGRSYFSIIVELSATHCNHQVVGACNAIVIIYIVAGLQGGSALASSYGTIVVYAITLYFQAVSSCYPALVVQLCLCCEA